MPESETCSRMCCNVKADNMEMIVIAVLIVLFCASAILYAREYVRNSTLRNERDSAKAALGELVSEAAVLKERVSMSESRVAAEIAEKAALQKEVEMVRSHAEEEQAALCQRLNDTEEQRKLAEIKLEQAKEAEASHRARCEALDREVELMGEERSKQQRIFSEQLALAREQLKTSAQEILNERRKELADHNKEQIEAIVNPLRENIAHMEKSLKDDAESHTRHRASLEKAIEDLMKRTGDIGSEADKLANALRSNNKVQGNWGELVLDELLASQGLEEGKHYDRQTTLCDASGNTLHNAETGRRMIPDVIVHYPDGKDVIVDSKVSLTAFLRYFEATTSEERDAALADHLKSVREHVKELAQKKYQEYIKAPRRGVDFVIMYIPNESALQLVLANDRTLWREAFDKRVFISGSQNLTAILRMIQIAWAQQQQIKNHEEIVKTGQLLVERVAGMFDQFEGVRKGLASASSAYDATWKKLTEGSKSVAATARRLGNFGISNKSKYTLPESSED